MTYIVAKLNTHGFPIFARFSQLGDFIEWTGNVDTANHFASKEAAYVMCGWLHLENPGDAGDAFVWPLAG